jgi:hypothetical protein
VHIPFALDDASSNGLLVEYAKQYYKQQNTDLNFKVVVTITNTACVPHQLNIASLVGLANLGGGKPRDNKRFLSQFISATHTFATSTHVVKIWDGAVHTIEGTRLMTRVEAAREGIPVSDDEDFLLKVELLTFLACRIIGKASLTPKQKRLLEAIPGYLNSALVYWVSGAEPVRIVDVPGNGWTQDQCLDGLQFFLDRSATVFSEGRWGTATPSFAMQAFWELPHSLSHRALKRGFDRKKLEARIISIGDSTEEKDQFSKTLNTRLSSCFEFHDREAQSDYRSTLAVMTNDFIQISLQHAFAVDSRIVTDLREYAKRQGGGSMPDLGVGVDGLESLPPALEYAMGTYVRKNMANACKTFTNDFVEAPRLVQAFRVAFHGVNDPRTPDRIKQFWRCNFPVLARGWIGLVVAYERYPFPLLRMAASSTSDSEKRGIARALLHSRNCCRDDGTSDVLIELASLYTKDIVDEAQRLEARLDFLTSERILTLVRAIGITQETCIWALECVNRFLRTIAAGGRPVNFANKCDKVYLNEVDRCFKEPTTYAPL